MSASTTVESTLAARPRKRVSRVAFAITIRVISSTTAGPKPPSELPHGRLVRHPLIDRDQTEPPQMQRVRHLPHQRLIAPAGALLDHHQPHERRHRDRRPPTSARPPPTPPRSAATAPDRQAPDPTAPDPPAAPAPPPATPRPTATPPARRQRQHHTSTRSRNTPTRRTNSRNRPDGPDYFRGKRPGSNRLRADQAVDRNDAGACARDNLSQMAIATATSGSSTVLSSRGVLRRLEPVALAVGVGLVLMTPSIVWVSIDRSIWPWDEAYCRFWYDRSVGDTAPDPRVMVAGNDTRVRHLASGDRVGRSVLRPPRRHPWLGPSPALLFSNEAALVAAIGLLYLAGLRVADGRRLVALVGPLMAGSAPLLVNLSHWYRVEPIQILSIVWVLFVMASARGWHLSLTAMTLVAALSFGVLAKMTTPAYVAMPTVVALVLEVVHRHAGSRVGPLVARCTICRQCLSGARAGSRSRRLVLGELHLCVGPCASVCHEHFLGHARIVWVASSFLVGANARCAPPALLRPSVGCRDRGFRLHFPYTAR